MENDETKKDEREVTRRKIPIKILLEDPITIGEDEIKELIIKRKPTGADWTGFNVQNATVGDYQRVASKLTGLPLPIIRKADTRATFELVEVISSFLD